MWSAQPTKKKNLKQEMLTKINGGEKGSTLVQKQTMDGFKGFCK